MAVVEVRRTEVAAEQLDHQWTRSTPPVTEEPVWVATVLAVKCLLVYLFGRTPRCCRFLIDPWWCVIIVGSGSIIS